jgi:site-specific recombinase XerD
MTRLRQKMIDDMTLAGLSANTKRLYTDAVYGLAKHYMRSPDQLSEEEVRAYLLYVKDEKQLAEGTLRICYYGLKFLYMNTLGRPWPFLTMLRTPKSNYLPTILSADELRSILVKVKIPKHRMCLTLIYACGLRISEATQLKVSGVDSERMVINVRGKGQKDRIVPLPEPLLHKLREYWKIERSKPWMFPGKNPGKPVTNNTVRRALYKAAEECGLNKRIVPHSLRHTYAVHLLENKVDARIIQLLLGHKHPKTTAIYTRLTPQVMENVQSVLYQLTSGL